LGVFQLVVLLEPWHQRFKQLLKTFVGRVRQINLKNLFLGLVWDILACKLLGYLMDTRARRGFVLALKALLALCWFDAVWMIKVAVFERATLAMLARGYFGRLWIFW
jgi:hypothetical protein